MEIVRFRIRSLRLLAIITFFSIGLPLPARCLDTVSIITVGGTMGWTNQTNQTYYQLWAKNLQTLFVDNVLDFGFPTKNLPVLVVLPEQRISVPQADLQSTCMGLIDGTVGGPVIPAVYNNTFIRTPVTYSLQSSGNLTFLYPFECYAGSYSGLPLKMAFTVFVAPRPGDSGGRTQHPPGGIPSETLPSISPSEPPDEVPFRQRSKHDHEITTIGWILTGVGVLAFLAIALMVSMAYFWKRTWKNREDSGRSEVSYISDPHGLQHVPSEVDAKPVQAEWSFEPRRFSYSRLKRATDNFNSVQVIGVGGFGTVYKGCLDSPRAPVAVKRLSQYASQGAKEFMAEVNIISQLRHRNLVQLLGWCDENEELILVYQFMPNGDLDEHIFCCGPEDSSKLTPLTWPCRYNIFCGVATALVYLHEDWDQRVVHRDVKTSNVMLDSNMNARLGDFGLARLSAHSQAPRTTMVAGTIGYLAPEFNLTGRATDKTDVYAYGVVLLEVSCARRPLTWNCILLDWIWELQEEEKLLDAIDPKLNSKSAADEEQMQRVLRVGLWCCHPDPESRPSMRRVLNILKGDTPLPSLPRSKPVAVFT